MDATKRNRLGKAVLLISAKEAAELLARLEEAAAEGGLKSHDEMVTILAHRTGAETKSLFKRWRQSSLRRKEAKRTLLAKNERNANLCTILREWIDLSQAEAADEFGISRYVYWEIESGKASFDATMWLLRKLCKKAGWPWSLFETLVVNNPEC